MTTTRIKKKLNNIDLADMSKEERLVLGHYLDKHKDQAVILPNDHCKAKVRQRKKTIHYTFGIHNKLLHVPGDPTFDVQANVESVGRGSFGKARELSGKLIKKDNGQAFFIPNPKPGPRLVKKVRQLPDETEKEFLESINREYFIAEKLPHLFFEPLIDDVGAEHHTAYIRMTYFIGKNLHDLIQSGSLNNVDEVIEISLNAALSLQMMFHDRGIVHRDIKPRNMTVTRFKQVAIYDVGLAKVVDEKVDYEYAGTLSYMSPEQINQSKTTPATDIYSLGKTYAKIWKLISETFLDEDKALNKKERKKMEKLVLSGDVNFDRQEFDKWVSLKDEHKENIVGLIKSMTRFKDQDRCNLSEVIALWDKIKLERKLDKSRRCKHKNIKQMHQQAIAERNGLRESLLKGETFRFKM